MVPPRRGWRVGGGMGQRRTGRYGWPFSQAGLLTAAIILSDHHDLEDS